MELELTKEQSWISESVDTLLSREWVAPADIVSVSAERRRRTWTALVQFGALSIGDEGELVRQSFVSGQENRLHWSSASVCQRGTSG